MKSIIFALVLPFTSILAYLPSGKDGLLPDILLRGLVDQINGKQGGDISYLDLSDGLPLDTRALSRDLEEEQLFPLDYENLGQVLKYANNLGKVFWGPLMDEEPDVNMYPSIRDQEYLQHTSLWGNQYISGGAGDGNQILTPGIKISKQEIKTDASLPAYCNPPNPCPVGYDEEQGCLADFENTSSFSRNYQSLQDCMCDTEHMFDCPRATNPLVDNSINAAQVDFSRLLQSFKNMKTNPFLAGEKLPVAAKKGNNMY